MDIDLLALSDLADLFVATIPIGFLVGCIPMIIGAVINGILAIFKRL